MESIEELSGSPAEGGDQLLPPPTNPAGPPQAIADMIRNSAQRNVDWVKTPGRVMQGVTPTVPGQWSEEDEFRQQSLNQHQYDWGAQTAFSDVFWPRSPAVGGLTSGAGSKITQPAKRTTVQGEGMPVEVGKIGPAETRIPKGWIPSDNRNELGGNNFAGLEDMVGRFKPSLRVAKFEPYDPSSVVGSKMLAARSSDGGLLGTITPVPSEGGFRVIAEAGPRPLWINAVVPTMDEAKALINKRMGVKLTPVEHDPFAAQ